MDAKRATKIGIGCTVAMLLPTIVLGWWVIDWARGVANWSEKADEFPTVAELRGDPIPDDENAALVYEKAWEALELTEEQEELLRDDDATVEALRPIVEQNHRAVSLLREAAQMQKCRFEPVPDDQGGPFPDQPHLSKLRALGRLLQATAVIQAADGHASGALSRIADEVAMSDHLQHKPSGVIEYLVARALLIRAARSLEEVLVSTDPSPRQASELRSRLRELAPGPSLELTLDVATANGLHVLNHYAEHPADETIEADVPVGRDNPLWTAFIALNRVSFAREMERFRELSAIPWREVADEMEQLGRQFRGAFFTGLLLPITSVSASRDDMLARREMMLVALDIEAFIAEHGGPPESLDELIEARGIEDADYAIDVFSAERLRYEPGEGDGYTIWSIGRDLDDDGGISRREAVKDPDRESSDADVVFRVEPTP